MPNLASPICSIKQPDHGEGCLASSGSLSSDEESAAELSARAAQQFTLLGEWPAALRTISGISSPS